MNKTGTSVQDTRAGQAPPSVERYTIEQLARTVGMSPRNIRAHQTRRLLEPPVREGRTAYYDAQHLRRLETIQSLQEQGFNLTAIEAILAAPHGAATGDLLPAPRRTATADPRLVPGPSRHDLVGRDGDCSLRPLQTRMQRSALELNQPGLTAAESLRLLVDVLDDLRVVADRVGRAAEARRQPVSRSASGAPAWEVIEGGRCGFTDGLAELLAQVAQAFRFAVGDPGRVDA
jgi:DNA-binding transcriptional MerR regulator